MRTANLKLGARWFALLVVTTLSAAGGRHLIKKIPVPGDYGWDYLTADSEGRRLYVSHDKDTSGGDGHYERGGADGDCQRIFHAQAPLAGGCFQVGDTCDNG